MNGVCSTCEMRRIVHSILVRKSEVKGQLFKPHALMGW